MNTSSVPPQENDTETLAVLRWCPLCETEVFDAPTCPIDGMATLLSEPPPESVEPCPDLIVAHRYRLEERIGEGNQARIYRAVHLGTGNAVAVKVISHRQVRRAEVRRLFLEARTTAALTHPNTIRVFDFGQDDTGLYYLAMEHLRGQTLAEELEARQRQGRVFSEEEVIAIGDAVLRSLAEAHTAGLVHRDLKPSNIFLHQLPNGKPLVKVLDFGLVGFVEELSVSGARRLVVGSPAYMSPEQVQSLPVDGRSDLYSLAAVLFELCTGRTPFLAESVTELLFQKIQSEPPRLREIAPGPLSSRITTTIEGALIKDPALRFPDADAMRAALVGSRTAQAKPFLLRLEFPTLDKWEEIERTRQAVLSVLHCASPDGDRCRTVAIVLAELLENAHKYAGRGSPPKLEVEVLPSEAVVRVTSDVPDSPAMVEHLESHLSWLSSFGTPEQAFIACLQRVAAEGTSGGLGLARVAYEANCRLGLTREENSITIHAIIAA